MTAGPTTRSYWPGLDGLRGLAILLVVIAHAGFGLGPTGGQVGVTLFFVLSGFLITSILVSERDTVGSIDLRRFYGRRIRRLAPGLLFFLGVSGLILKLGFDWFPLWASTWPGLFYVSNLAQMVGIDVGPNTHLWSLSVEEHFYALWPLILLKMKRLSTPAALVKVAVALAVFRFIVGSIDPNWAYHGTLSNSYALLIGCAIAVASSRGSLVAISPRSAEIGALILVLLSFWPVEDKAELLRVGIWLPVVAAVVSAVMIMAILNANHFLFEMGWLRYMGRISYGWYLWHAPFLFMAALNDTPEKRLASVIGTFAIASFSWHVVEKRFLRYRHRETAGDLRDKRTGVR